jgi:A/G-specific adenine glycosylase
MLQQTRVEVVIPYYEVFLQRFPDLKSLARSSLNEVLAAWSGLGYYRRARLLHQAARDLVAQGGRFPESSDALRCLPGIGPYTAAALASIAFGETVAAIDGNVERVLARCLALEQDPRRGEGRRRVAALAADLVNGGSPGDSNQALMELGATVCTPQNPKCDCCPLEQGCLGAAAGRPETLPVRKQRPPTRDVRLVVAVAQRGEEVLLFCRPEESGQLAGLWELPWVEWCGRSRAERLLGERFGGSWSLGPSRGRVFHTITDRRLRLEVHEASRVMDGSAQDVREGPEGGWFPLGEIGRLPTSSQVAKVLDVVLG